MFKHRLNVFGRISLLAACLLFVGGSLQSCKDWLDDYKYDDGDEPEWLGESVYKFLKDGTRDKNGNLVHTYENYTALIDSLGETETLSRTGSNTVFAADDKAFERFFENNPWGVKSVAEMSKSQMKMILYGSMLDNSLLLEVMANTGTGTADEGKCLRREVKFDNLDSVPVVSGASFKEHANWPTYNTYWDKLRGKGRKEKLLLAMDGTKPMMVHFLNDFLKRNNVEVSDIDFLFKKNGAGYYKEGDAFLFDRKIVKSDVDPGEFSEDTMTVTCKNGYVYRLDDVLVHPSNMAAELRNRKDTRITSHLLDRYCVPEYDNNLHSEYKGIKEDADSVFRLRYFSKNYSSNSLLKTYNPVSTELLSYDPGMNEYANDLGKQSDMAAMFVPKDSLLYEYFANPDSLGYFMIEYFAPDDDVPVSYAPENVDKLLAALDKVPQVNITPLMNNMLKASFVGTVLSKFDKIVDDANVTMGIKGNDVDECLIANNGVVYLLNKVFSPSTYASVYGPTLIYEDMSIMRMAIEQLQYNYYLLAMDANYSLVIPDNNHFVYYDYPTYVDENSNYDMYVFHYDSERDKNDKNVPELWFKKHKVNPSNLEIKESEADKLYADNLFDAHAKNRLTDMMEYLIILHDVDKGDSIRAEKKYYSTKGYGTMKVDASDPNSIKFYGGEQLEKGTTIVASSKFRRENGYSFCTVPLEESQEKVLYTSIPTPPTRSVYKNMIALATDPEEGQEEGLYTEFYKICNPANFASVLQEYIFKDVKTEHVQDSIKFYSIFYSGGTAKNNGMLVPFFSTYHYTVYVPSNESIRNLYEEKGMPNLDVVIEQIKNGKIGNEKAMSIIRMMNGFARYHFQDNSVYCDILPFSISTPSGPEYHASFETAASNPSTGSFYKVDVRSESNSPNAPIIVKDVMGNERKIVTTGEENKEWNVMCRDIVYAGNNFDTSSFSVIQPIDGPLLNDNLFGYDGMFKRFVNTGECVQEITVKDGTGYKGDEQYLVAVCGKKKVAIDNVKKDSVATIAYLLKEIDSTHEDWNSAITRETYVLDEKEEPVYITMDGYRVKSTKDAKGNVTYSYYTVEEGNNVYKVQVDNNGQEIIANRVLLYTKEVETPDENESESDDSTNDEE